MKFIEVTAEVRYSVTKETIKKYININHIIYFKPCYFLNKEIDYTRVALRLIGEKDILIIKCNIENFKDNLIKLHII
jgi:hypothetical protein